METEQIYSTLQAELASVQSKVNSWSLNKEKDLQNLKSSHTAFLDSHNELTQQLKGREKQIKSRAEKNSAEAEKQSEATQLVETEIESLQETLMQLPEELSELEKRLEAEKENMIAAQKGLANSERTGEHKTSVLGSGTHLFEKYMGLRFERQVQGVLGVNMVNIDPSNPKKVFSFNIRLQDNEQYSVSDCSPAVHALPEMLRELNSSNSLTTFVRGMRKEWRRMVA